MDNKTPVWAPLLMLAMICATILAIVWMITS